jgi:hypothetical protein
MILRPLTRVRFCGSLGALLKLGLSPIDIEAHHKSWITKRNFGTLQKASSALERGSRKYHHAMPCPVRTALKVQL